MSQFSVLKSKAEHARGQKKNGGGGGGENYGTIDGDLEKLNNGCALRDKDTGVETALFEFELVEHCSWRVPFCQWQLASWVPAEKCQDGSTAERLKGQEGFNLHKNIVQHLLYGETVAPRTWRIQPSRGNQSLNQRLINLRGGNVILIILINPNSAAWRWTRRIVHDLSDIEPTWNERVQVFPHSTFILISSYNLYAGRPKHTAPHFSMHLFRCGTLPFYVYTCFPWLHQHRRVFALTKAWGKNKRLQISRSYKRMILNVLQLF